MRNTLLVATLLTVGLSACGQKEDAAQTEAVPAPTPMEQAADSASDAVDSAADAAVSVSDAATQATAEVVADATAAVADATAAVSAAADSAAGSAKFKASCASCHGAKGQGMGTFPKLAGLTADVFKSRMADYKAGKQVGPQSAVMMPIASMLSDADVDNLAAHIATLK